MLRMRMLQMKSKRGLLLVIILIFLTGCSTISLEHFNGENAYKHIKELSSNEYEGRLLGTEGNKKATKYIENEFKKIGLRPFKRESYLQPFRAISSILGEKASLKVIDKNGQTIKDYRLRKDFTEVTMDYAKGGKIVGKGLYNESFKDIETKDKIILTSKNPHEENISKILLKNRVKAVIRPSNKNNRGINNNRFGKSVVLYKKQEKKIKGEFIDLIVNKNVFDELVRLSKEGKEISIDLDLKFPEVEMSNVIGYIPGEDDKLKKETILISAHFDHVGKDPNGEIYHGALDNSSGVATLIELARTIKESNIKPKRTIVFAAFNGEESGLQGSEYYTSSRPFDLIFTKVINLDMVGSKEKVKLEIKTSPSQSPKDKGEIKGEELIKTIRDLAKELNINYKINKYSFDGDHFSFSSKGIPAITLTNNSKELIHTPDDDISNIDKNRLDKVGKLALSIVNYYALNAKDVNNISNLEERSIFFKNFFIFLLVLLSIITLFVLLYKLTRKEKLNNCFKNKPIFSIILFVLFLFSILIFNSDYEYENFNKTRMVNTNFYETKPWKVSDKLTTNKSTNIIDADFDRKLRCILKDEKETYLLTLNDKGEVIEKEDLNLHVEDLKISNKDIFFKKDNKLYKLDENNNKHKILDNVEGYKIVKNKEYQYIVAYNKDKIKIKGEDIEKEINVNSILNLKAQIDEKNRIYIVTLRKNKGFYNLEKMYISSKGIVSEIKKVHKLTKEKDFRFGIDKARGYIFYKRNKKDYYITFYLGSINGLQTKEKRLKVTGENGILIETKGLPHIKKGYNSQGKLTAIYNGLDKYDEGYIKLLRFFNGDITERKTLYNDKQTNIKKTLITSNENDEYVFWQEGKDSNIYATSSNPEFGEELLKNKILIRIDNIIQNIILAFILALFKLHCILPAFLILVLLRLIGKGRLLEKTWVMVLGVVINILFEIFFITKINQFTFSKEYIIIPILIALLALIVVIFYKYEKNNTSILKLFIIFIMINFIFITSLYAPYSQEGGLERIQQNEYFN
ncbi:MAG: Zn-dependent exopeptidase M28 [Firmicutes bacterium]|nr:Zn-dependent exopeptidase M28 [Bacillota bacterium]